MAGDADVHRLVATVIRRLVVTSGAVGIDRSASDVRDASPRDTLLRLVNTHASPFLGSTIRDLPLLDDGFVRFVADHIERERPDLAPVDAAALALAFGQLGHRPQVLERALIWRMLDTGARYRPFDADSLTFYRKALDDLGESSAKVTRSSVQKALEALRRHEPPLVWKSVRGEYAIDDVPMRSWHESLVRTNDWPPGRIIVMKKATIAQIGRPREHYVAP